MVMKAWTEGMRSLIYYGGLCHDRMAVAKTEEEKAAYASLLEVLTPIIKGYVTDKAFDVCSQGIQVYGGYGYIEEFPVAQLLRDSRIFMIYEGTNGIQSIDLLGRKLGMKNGKPFIAFLDEIRKTITGARNIKGVEALAETFDAFLSRYTETALNLARTAMSDKVQNAYAFSHPFLDVTGDLVMAWMLLWRAAVAAPKIGEKKKDDAFYQGQVTTARFFINTILPVTLGRLNAIDACDGAAVDMDDASFGSK